VPHLDLESVRDLIRRSRAPAGSEADQPDPTMGTGEELIFEDNPNWLIPDNDSAGLQAEIVIPDGIRGKVTVSLQIFHTFLNDLYVEVVAPTGERWTLFDHEEVFELDLIEDYPLEPQPSTNLGGTWRLNIADLAEVDEGILEAWTITVTQ
jgi:subtilisin-like proprotein convertase family protein